MVFVLFTDGQYRGFAVIAVTATEVDEKSWVFLPPKEPTGVILVSFDHFASYDFNV